MKDVLAGTQYRLSVELDDAPGPVQTLHRSRDGALDALGALSVELGLIRSTEFGSARGRFRHGDRCVGSWSIQPDLPDFPVVLGIDDLAAHDFPAAWARSADDETLTIPVGYRRDDDELLPTIDYLELGAMNVAVTGRAGSGKSYLLRGMALALASKYGPDRLGLVFVDGFPGATWLGLDALPHTVGWAMDTFFHRRHDFDRLLTWLEAEVDRRLSQGDSPGERPPQLVVFMDEVVPFLDEDPDTAARVARLAEKGPSAGMNLILGSQFLTGGSVGGVLTHCDVRYTLALNSARWSREMIGVADAAELVTGPLEGKALRRFDDGDVVPMVALPSQARAGGLSMGAEPDAALLDRLTFSTGA